MVLGPPLASQRLVLFDTRVVQFFSRRISKNVESVLLLPHFTPQLVYHKNSLIGDWTSKIVHIHIQILLVIFKVQLFVSPEKELESNQRTNVLLNYNNMTRDGNNLNTF